MSQNIIKIDNLSKKIRRHEILHSISLEVPKGKIIGLLGPNGAGKTTLLKCILNLYRYSGEIYINGEKCQQNNNDFLSELGGVIEDPCFYSNLSGMQNLRIAALHYTSVSKKDIDAAVSNFSMESYIQKPIKDYSLGMKQRLALAMSMLHNPSILVLDEPMNGLDPQGIHDLRELLRSLCEERGTTVIVSSHILSEMQLLCDQVVFIKQGKIVGNEPVGDMLEDRYLSIMNQMYEH